MHPTGLHVRGAADSRRAGFKPVFMWVLGIVSAVFFLAPCAFAKTPDIPWEKLRKEHPRLFINKDLLRAVGNQANGDARVYYDGLVHDVEQMLHKDIREGDHGTEAAAAALLGVLNGRSDYISLAVKLLESSIAYYRKCDRAKQGVSWRSDSRINAICAYDWLFNSLGAEDRQRMGRDLLEHVEAVQPGLGRKKFPGENWSTPRDGCYGTPGLLWFAGIATYGEGVDDETAKRFIERGYDIYYEVLKVYDEFSGDDGGFISPTLNYALVSYPLAVFNFFHTLKSAFDTEIAVDWPFMPLFVNFVLWNWLPGERGFGIGDDYHETNRLPLWECYTHLAQIRHFYHKSHPDYAALAAWLQQKMSKGKHSETFPAIPLLLTGIGGAPPPKAPSEFSFPSARHFEVMGEFLMHSSWSDNATYALFNAGGRYEQHKHFDENHFGIFSGGFLALDTGSRPEPGSHLYNYYCRTIAHNCMLIHMPGEKMPGYWGDTIEYAPEEPPLPTPNDGGQREFTGSKILGFETHPEYTYIAGDATAVYHPDKCSLVLRQFVFVPPRHFVIFDRVVAKEPNYRKTWLLHTAGDIKVNGPIFSTEHEDGRLFGCTLLPKNAELKTIGGPGKQFWNGGRNWPLPLDYKINPDDSELFNARSELLGVWRLEVSPAARQKSDVFLHLLETGPKGAPAGMSPARLIEGAKDCGVEFQYADMKVTVTFGMEGPPSGRIKYEMGGRSFDRAFTDQVEKQSGLADGRN